jgi:hypothetical protein
MNRIAGGIGLKLCVELSRENKTMKSQRGRLITGWRHVEPPKAKRSFRKISPTPVTKVSPAGTTPVTPTLAKAAAGD